MWAGRAREASVLRSASWHAACGRGVRLKQGVPTFCKSDARARDAHQGVPLVPLISPRSNPVFSPWADSAVGKGARACTRTDRHSDTHQPVFFFHGMSTVYLYPNVDPASGTAVTVTVALTVTVTVFARRRTARAPRRPPQVALGLASANFPQWSPPSPPRRAQSPMG
jgi:hypothetical protein